MIFEPDIRETDDGAICRPPFGGPPMWQIHRTGPEHRIEELWNASTKRATIDRAELLQFSYRRGRCKVLDVPMSFATLQTFTEHLQGDVLEARAVEQGLLVRQGHGFGFLGRTTWAEPEVPASFTLEYDVGTTTRYREDIADAKNSADFARWVQACVDEPMTPHVLDFENADKIHERHPTFGAPVPTLWFDDHGYGPSCVEVVIDGFDVIDMSGARLLSRRVALSLPGTSLTGGGSFGVRTLTRFRDQVDAALQWMKAGLMVPGCECGICSPHMSRDCWCEGSKAAHVSDVREVLDNPTIDPID